MLYSMTLWFVIIEYIIIIHHTNTIKSKAFTTNIAWKSCKMQKSETLSKLETYSVHAKQDDRGEREITHLDYYKQYESNGLTSTFRIDQIFKKTKSIKKEKRPHLQHDLNQENKESESQRRLQHLAVSSQCTIAIRPLCYPGICNGTLRRPDNQTTVFYKRLLASPNGEKAPKALWMIQGGPGAPSTAMDTLLLVMKQFLGDTIDLYTMDHRGTGLSDKLKCTTWNNYDGTLRQCINNVERYTMDERPESFSVTSAAYDLKTGIEEFNQGQDVYVYGVSYGTYLVERMMQLKPLYVKGYILDGIVAQTGHSTFTTWDEDVGDIGNRFLEYCDKSKACSKPFKNVPLKQYIQDLYKEIDTTSNQCIDLLANLSSSDSSDPSDLSQKIAIPRRVGLRHVRGIKDSGNITTNLTDDASMTPSGIVRAINNNLLESQTLRPYIPVLVYLLKNCNDANFNAFTNFLLNTMGSNSTVNSRDSDSELLYYLIVFSELWQIPTPSVENLTRTFEKQSMAGGMQTYVPSYCALTQANDSACETMKSTSYLDKKFMYQKDQYYPEFSTIPDGASVLMLNGKLDPQTHYRHAMFQYDNMKGDNKLLLLFDTSSHGVILNSPLKDPTKLPCGAKIIASYIANNGSLQSIDSSCMKDVNPLDLSLSMEMNVELLGRPYAYGSSSNIESSTASCATIRYITMFIIVLSTCFLLL